jgi:hypothetical protein
MADHRYECKDCGVDVLATGDWYMATPDLWGRQLGLGRDDNLCLACLERRLGRPVVPLADIVPVTGTLNRVWPERLSARMIELFPPTPRRRRPPQGAEIRGCQPDNETCPIVSTKTWRRA